MVLDVARLNNEQKFALLYGILLGDGCLSYYISSQGREGFSISITCCYKDDKPFFEKIVLPLVISLRGKQTSVKERPERGTIELNFCDKVFFYRIKNYGFPVGKKGPYLLIPQFFYKEDLLKHLIGGFFATDGSIVLTKNPTKFYPRLEAHVIHKDLIKQIYDHLIGLGMKGHFYKCKRNKTYKLKRVHDQYRFQFNGKDNLLLFDQLIGFVNPKHQKKFFDFMKYDSEYNLLTRRKQAKELMNIRFMDKMAAPGIGPGALSS